MAFLRDHFWCLDFAIGASILLCVCALFAAKRLSPLTFRLFLAGLAIGLTWEIPLSTLDGLGIVHIFDFLTSPPAPFAVVLASHTCWDGGLCLVGLGLVRALCPAPHFVGFRWRELLVLLAWGQLQELGIELLSSGSAGWTYVPAWWNPSLFQFQGKHITLVPQLMWLWGAAAFYAAARALTLSLRDGPSPADGQREQGPTG